MRHRRESFSGGRAFHGNERRENRNDFRDRNRCREPSTYRDRGERDPSYCFHRSRYSNSNVTRQSERPLTFDHLNRGQTERLRSSDNSSSRDLSSQESFKAYLNKKYCDTSVSSGTSNFVSNDSIKTCSDSLNSLNKLDWCSEREIGDHDIPSFQTHSENRLPGELNKQEDQYNPRIQKDRNFIDSEQSRENTRRIPTFERPVQYHGSAACRSVQSECNTYASQSDWDFTRPEQDATHRFGINIDPTVPFRYNNNLNDSAHRPVQVEHSVMKLHPSGEFENKSMYDKPMHPLPDDLGSLQDQVYGKRHRYNLERPARFEPVAFSSPCVRNSVNGNNFISRQHKTNQFGSQHPIVHETLHPVNPPLFTRNGQPVLRREIPRCPSGLGLMSSSNNTRHIYERDRTVYGPGMFLNTSQDKQWTFPGMPLVCRPDEHFKPVCVTEAINFMEYADNGSKSDYTPQPSMTFTPNEGVHHTHMENVPTPQGYFRKKETCEFSYIANTQTPRPPSKITKSPGQYAVDMNVSVPEGKVGATEAVALIPLPLDPSPLPQPLPPHSHHLPLQEQVPLLPGIFVPPPPPPPPPPQGGVETRSQKPCANEPVTENLLENQVSSTSMELDQVSSSVELQDPPKTESLDTSEKTKLLKESQNQNCEEKTQMLEKEHRLVPVEDLKQNSSGEKSIRDGNAPCSEVKNPDHSNKLLFSSVARYAKLLEPENRDVHHQDFRGKCNDEKIGNHFDKGLSRTTNNAVVTDVNKNEIAKDSLNRELGSISVDSHKGIKHNTFETENDKQCWKNAFVANSSYNQNPKDTYRRSDSHFTRNYRSPSKKDEFLHRPWETDHWRHRQMRVNRDFSNNSKARDQWSFEPLCRRRPYIRPYDDDRRKLSGLGIHTYRSNLDRVRERNSYSTLGYFRPWERLKTAWREINRGNDKAYEFSNCSSSFPKTNLFPDEEFWRDEYTLDCKEKQFTRSNFAKRNIAQNINGKSFNDCESDWQLRNSRDRRLINLKGSSHYNQDSYPTETKQTPFRAKQESALGVFQESWKNQESDKDCETTVKNKQCTSKTDSQNENDSKENVSKQTQIEKCNVIYSGEANDRFAKKRQEKYNHGHSYLEIVAVKSKTNSDKKVNVNKHATKGRSVETISENPKLKTIKTSKKESFQGLNNSKLLKSVSETAVSTLSSLPKLDGLSKVSTKLSFSKVAKPDISLENRLFKSMIIGHKAVKTGFDLYKIPHLERHIDDSQNTIGKIKNSSKKTVDDEDVTKEQLNKNIKGIVSVKAGVKRKSKKIPDKKKYRSIAEKTEKKNKLGIKTRKEKQNVVDLKSLHPKLRHKFFTSSDDLKKRKLKKLMDKCVFESSVDKSEKDSSDKGKTCSKDSSDKGKTCSKDSSDKGKLCSKDSSDKGKVCSKDSSDKGKTCSKDSSDKGKTCSKDSSDKGKMCSKDSSDKGKMCSKDSFDKGKTCSKDSSDKGKLCSKDSSDKGKTCSKDSSDKGKTCSLKRRYTRTDSQHKTGENDSEQSKQNSSLLTRGKFVLSTPNTFEVKDSKKTKVKETVSGIDTLEDKGTLDKALFSAKKHLLYRALAVNALKRDKTKPLVEKKHGARKSLITADMAKDELKVLNEILTIETEKLPEQKDENNNSTVRNEKVEDDGKASGLKLDIPTTTYQPQRTAIGNYATQCLFGPIVSSTFYKAPGKARVIRNAKESFIGYTKCPEDIKMNDTMFAQPLIESNVNESNSSRSMNVGGQVCNVETKGTVPFEKASFIEVTSVSCNVSPCFTANSTEASDSLKENYKGATGQSREKLLSMKTKNSLCEQEIQTSCTSTSDSKAHLTGFDSKKKLKTIISLCDEQKKLVATNRNEVRESLSVEKPLCNSLFLNPQKDVFSISDQFEMHKKYLKCKQELAESCCTHSEFKTGSAPVLPPVLSTFPLTTHTVSSFESRQKMTVNNSSPVHENTCTDVNHVSLNENATDFVSKSFEPKSNIDQNIPFTFSGDMQYEPSNEEFEMYRDYQIQRTLMFGNKEEGEPHGSISDFSTCLEWKGISEKPEGARSSFDTTEHEKDNPSRTGSFDKEQVNMAADEYHESEASVSVDTSMSVNLSSDMYVNMSFEENDPEPESVQYGEERVNFKKKPSCDIVNLDSELQDTSKDMFEDIVTDILKDEDLISSIPINPPDITKEITYNFTNVVNENEKLNDTQLTDSIKVEHVSPQIPFLSPKCPLQEVQDTGMREKTKDEKEQRNVFKSARTPIHLGISRKPRFEKRFPKPLPRTKTQKSLTAERELYEAAERFLGDFDHSHKRSCCKGKFELLINPVTGKLESVKMNADKKEEPKVNTVKSNPVTVKMESVKVSADKKEEPKVNPVKSDTVQSLGNYIAESKDDNFTVDKQHWAKNSKTKKTCADLKRSVDSNVVTRQQLAMKKLIQKPKKQKLRTRSKTGDTSYKGTSFKRSDQSKGSNRIKNSLMSKRRIPSIRLKTVMQPGVKDKNTTEKWENVTFKYNGKRKRVTTNVTDTERLSSKSSKKPENRAYKDIAFAPTETKNEPDVKNKVKVSMSKQSCKLCTYSCDSSVSLMLHCNKNHPSWCHRCEKEFKDKAACRNHVRQNHESRISCELCRSTFRKKFSYDRHLNSKCHQEKKKMTDFRLKGKLDTKHETEVAEAVIISDEEEEESGVEIVDLSSDCSRTTGKEDHDSQAGRHKKHKTKTSKSTKLKYTQNERKRKQTDAVATETSEDEVQVKKANCLQYCNVCRQYYKKIGVHFQTGKHHQMLNQQRKQGKANAVSQEVVHTLTIDDTDHDTPLHTDDDTVNDDDVQTIDSMSPSSCRSVVIVSDHDSHYSFQDETFTSDDSLPEIYEEENVIDTSQSQERDQKLKSTANKYSNRKLENLEECSVSQNGRGKVDEDNVNVKTDVEAGIMSGDEAHVNIKTVLETRIMPVVVSTSRGEVCSPTLLVKNIAADLMCKEGVKDSRQNIFDSLCSEQKYLKESSPSYDKSEHDHEVDNQVDAKDNKSDNKKENTVTQESGLIKKSNNRRILDGVTKSYEEVNENVAIVEMVSEEDRNMSADTVPEHCEENDSVSENADMVDYQVTENPSSPEEVAGPDTKEVPSNGEKEGTECTM